MTDTEKEDSDGFGLGLFIGLAAAVIVGIGAYAMHPTRYVLVQREERQAVSVIGSVVSADGVAITPLSYAFAEHAVDLHFGVVASHPVDYARIACRFTKQGALITTDAIVVIDRRAGDSSAEWLHTYASDEPDAWSCKVDSVR
jgi:hypothetical protein